MISDGRGSSYYQHRAEAELKMAQKARGVEAVRAHKALATLYLDRMAPADRPRFADNDRSTACGALSVPPADRPRFADNDR